MHRKLPSFFSSDDTEVTEKPYVCGMTPGPTCVGIISLWSVGLPGVCPHEESGMLIGGTWGIKKAAIQVILLTTSSFFINTLPSDYIDQDKLLWF